MCYIRRFRETFGKISSSTFSSRFESKRVFPAAENIFAITKVALAKVSKYQIVVNTKNYIKYNFVRDILQFLIKKSVFRRSKIENKNVSFDLFKKIVIVINV